MTHDYKRHGTTTLFAALGVLEGKVLGRCMQRHRHQEFVRFLNAIKRDVQVGELVHVILDNYATHKHPKVRESSPTPSLHLNFTPTSCSWANAVEGFFAKLTRRRLKPGVFKSIVDLDRRQSLHHRGQNSIKALRLDQTSRYHPRSRQTREQTLEPICPLDRYAAEVSPSKKGAGKEVSRLKMMKRALGTTRLDDLRPGILLFKEHRLRSSDLGHSPSRPRLTPACHHNCS